MSKVGELTVKRVKVKVICEGGVKVQDMKATRFRGS